MAKAGLLLLLVVLTGALVYLILAGKAEPKKEVSTAPVDRAVHLTPHHEAYLPIWGREIARMISENRGEEISRLHDYDAIVALTVEGIDDWEMRRLVERATKSAVTAKAGGFLANETGQSAHFLRVCTRAGFPAVTLRMNYGIQQFAYMDVLLQPAGEHFRIVDLYDYVKGTRRTEDVRYAMVPLLISQKPQSDSKWLEKWNLGKSEAEYLVSLLKAKIKGMDEDVLTVCDQAPESMQNNRQVFFSRTQALQRLSLSNPRYEQLYFESLQNPPAMPDTPHVLELLLVPKLLAASDYPGADAAVQKVMAVIGDDAQLLGMLAEIKLKCNELVAAKALLQKAAELEPDLPLLEELKRELNSPQ
ncbi:MAG: hypothetical protein NTY98_01275 [Verrucomicrobia bacterium]|nr:hypothetical protein [Verrucomicrobiota bacterium]